MYGLRLLIGAGGTAIFLGLVVGSLSTAGVIDMTVAYALLATAWVIGVAAIVISEPVWGLPTGHRTLVGVVCSVALGAVLICVGMYERYHRPAAHIENSRLQVLSSQITYNPNSKSAFRVTTINKGTIAAYEPRNGVAILVAKNKMSAQEEDMWAAAAIRVQFPGSKQNEFQPEDGASFTIDFDLSAEEYGAVIAGTSFLYTFISLSYRDIGISSNKRWISERCMYFQKQLNEGTLCIDHNRVFLADQESSK